METFWNTVLPAIAGAIVSMLAVGVPLLLRLAKARVEMQEQTVRGAVAQVDSMGEPAILLTDEQAKAEAVRLVQERLPASRSVSAEKLSHQIDTAVEQKRATDRASAAPAVEVKP